MKITKIGELPEFSLKSNLNTWSGSQGPTPLFNGKELKLSFSSRDTSNRSYCFTYTLNPENPLKIESNTLTPDYYPCHYIGRYYSDGFMISQYYTDINGNEFVYFTGWEDLGQSNKVRYRTACGQVKGKVEIGICPFIERTPLGPCGSSMPFRDKNIVYYMSIDRWSMGESFYSISSWIKTNQGYHIHNKEIERDSKEGGLARPVIFTKDNNKYMMFSSRGQYEFRSNKEEAYRLNIAKLVDDQWVREYIKVEGEEGFMQAYGYPIEVNGKWYLFYNNSFIGNICVGLIE